MTDNASPRRWDPSPGKGGPVPAGPTDLPERLRICARALADLKGQVHHELQLRGALIVAALDAGYRERDVAMWAGGLDGHTVRYWIAKTLGEQA